MFRRALVTFVIAVTVLAPSLFLFTHRTEAVQEYDPEIQASLAAINLYRSWLGIPPLTIDPRLQAAAEGHVNYYKLNYGDPNLAGMGLHQQTPGKPGFTGASMSDRAKAAGYTGSVNENAGLSGSMVVSTEWFIGTINHRITLIDARYTHIGLAAINEGNIKFEVIMLGAESWSRESEPEWVAWPPHNATGVGRAFYGEAPGPFPGATYPVGYPITLAWRGPGDLELDSVTLTANGKTVPSFHSIGTGWLSTNTAQVAASDPLEPGTTYQVTITGSANGERFSRTWSFTTTDGTDKLALNGVSAPPASSFEKPVKQQPTATATPDPTATPTETPTTPPAGFAPPTPTPAGSDYQQVELPDVLPPGVTAAPSDVQKLWWLADGPVWSETVKRSWLWGPESWIAVAERYEEEPDGARRVYYFDKARIEVNTSEVRSGLTAGLLVRDMILGSIQVGEAEFLEREPAEMALAGDGIEWNAGAPTYASLHEIASIEPGRSIDPRPGQAIVEVLNADGTITTNQSLSGMATYGSYDETLGHNVAKVFDDYLKDLAIDWQMSVGLPIADPYWVQTLVNQEPTWVLVQAFERRLLTYTPTNDPEWRVEMGNVGRHYYEWRYNMEAPSVYQEPAG